MKRKVRETKAKKRPERSRKDETMKDKREKSE